MKTAAAFTVAAALLTALAPNSTFAAPTDKAPFVSPLVSAKTVQFTMLFHMSDTDDKGKLQSESMVQSIVVQRPGKAHYTATQISPKGHCLSMVYVSDGKIVTMYDVNKNEYKQSPPSPQDDIVKCLALMPAVQPVPAVLNGKRCLLFTETDASDGSVARHWIDSATHLPVCEEDSIMHNGAKQTTMLINYTGWKLNAPVAESLFVFVPPKGVTLKKSIAAQQSEIDYTAKFLKPGTPAPDFTAYDGNGKAVHLSDYAGKVVLVDFWATWCGPCQRALPETNKIAKKYAGQVVTLGVNVWDEQSAFANWLPAHNKLDSMTFVRESGPRNGDVSSKAYGIVAIPSQYVVGKDGKVAAAFCGDTVEQLTAALNKAVDAPNTAP